MHVRICIASQDPGELEGLVSAPLEESDVLDFYDMTPEGGFAHVAQTRQCASSCSDAIEGIARRDAEVIIVAGLSPNSLLRLRNAGIKVLRANSKSVPELMKSLVTNSLVEIGINQFAKLGHR